MDGLTVFFVCALCFDVGFTLVAWVAWGFRMGPGLLVEFGFRGAKVIAELLG